MKLQILKGISLSHGIGIGVPVLLSTPDEEEVSGNHVSNSVAKEVKRYQEAVSLSISDVETLQEQLKEECAFEAVEVLEAHKQMLKDPLITEEVEQEIRKSKRSGISVLTQLIEKYKKRFRSIKNPIHQERFQDLRDVTDRVKAHLQMRPKVSFDELPQNAVIFAHEVTPTEVAKMRQGKVMGIVTRVGTSTSHAAIIAKAKGLPFIAGIPFDEEALNAVKEVVVDAANHEVIFNPDPKLLTTYRTKLMELVALSKAMEQEHGEIITKDGISVRLSLNIGSLSDLADSPIQQSSGVGLFRTEFLLESGTLPTEKEQSNLYADLSLRFQDKPVVVRLFDFGGDKELPHFLARSEPNPSLGCRAIRLLLKERNLLKKQLKALHEASKAGNIKILIPMISTLGEFLEVKEMIKEFDPHSKIPLGCMIEVPSAALMADLFAKKVDFFSIGTNDLSQFVMGADRTNQDVSHLYTAHHPSILRLIAYVIKEANKRGIPVSICGEIAADPTFTPLLLGLGLRELSVHPKAFANVRRAVRNTHIHQAEKIAKKALLLQDAAQVEKLLNK